MTFDACTLPTTEQPLRLAEFGALFATAQQVERPAPTRLRLRLAAPLAVVRDLTARESECCSFFDFSVTGSDGEVELTIAVPPAHVDVLDALAAR
jgi:hypothetical protein